MVAQTLACFVTDVIFVATVKVTFIPVLYETLPALSAVGTTVAVTDQVSAGAVSTKTA